MIEEASQALIAQAFNQQASDIHFIPHQNTYQVYLRINGQLSLWGERPLEWGRRVIAHLKFLANLDVGERRQPQSGACEVTINQGGDSTAQKVELRLSTITDVHLNESLVIRLIFGKLHQAKIIQTYFPQDLLILRRLVRRKSGLVLIAGPVGSGKTTTIYQLLRERIDQEVLQVITMEDPVEIKEPRFLQTQVNEKANISYDLLIKSALRHHPDVLFIGEIRDEETARMTIRGALTGHLMIATLHAKDTLGVLGRLQELNISQHQLSQTLIGIISQRLVPRHCPQCKQSSLTQCPHLSRHHKQAVLFEILTGSPLKKALIGLSDNLDLSESIPPLNKRLRKVWAYGYIGTQTYHHFEII